VTIWNGPQRRVPRNCDTSQLENPRGRKNQDFALPDLVGRLFVAAGRMLDDLNGLSQKAAKGL
jgi:hypothetical protein